MSRATRLSKPWPNRSTSGRCGRRRLFHRGRRWRNKPVSRLPRFVSGDGPLADIQLTLQTPFPGTALYRRLCSEGRLLENRGWSYYTLFDVTYQPDRMSVEALEEGFRSLLRQVFSAGPTHRRAEIRRRVWARHPGLSPCA
jgi:Domain of unknown function (DUF4070)